MTKLNLTSYNYLNHLTSYYDQTSCYRCPTSYCLHQTNYCPLHLNQSSYYHRYLYFQHQHGRKERIQIRELIEEFPILNSFFHRPHFLSLFVTQGLRKYCLFYRTINSLGARVKTSQPVSVIKRSSSMRTPERPSM